MKNIKLSTVIVLLATSISFAQGGKFKEKSEQVKALKVTFITNELSLTADESAKFWPVYNAFEDKQRSLRKQKLGSFMGRHEENSLDEMSEKDAATLLTQIENSDEEIYQLRKKLITNLKTILPAVKILKLKKAEEDFNRKLLKQYRQGRK